MNKEFAKLSWELLEHKVRYYYYDAPIITDDEYDLLEIKYLNLCKEFDQENTLVHKQYPGLTVNGQGMMEIDIDRPSVQAAIYKLRGIK